MKQKYLLIGTSLFCVLLLGGVLYLSIANNNVVQAHAPVQIWLSETLASENTDAQLPSEDATANHPAASLSPLGNSQSFTKTFYVQKDTWVDEANPTTSHGSDTPLYVGRDTSSNARQILIWFDISDLPPSAVVLSADLEMYSVTNMRQAGGAAPLAYNVWTDALNATWNEATVTWNSRPAASNQGDPSTSVSMGCGGCWFSWDVTNIAQGWVTSTLPNHGILLRGDASTQSLNWFTAYPSIYRPRLTINYITQGSPMMLPAQKDTWINQAQPSTNYGSDTQLYVGRDASSNARQTLIEFDVSALPGDIVVLSATLELYSVTNMRRAGSAALQAYNVWSDAILATWDESLVIWNNRPASSNHGDPSTSVSMGCPGCWFSWDVTNIVQGWATDALVNYGILLRGDGSTQGSGYFTARPGINAPRLTIYYEPEPPPPCYALTGASISGPTQGITDTSYAFDAALNPPTASEPFTYTWQATDQPGTYAQPSASFAWGTPGAKTVTVTVENCGGIVTATHPVAITAPAPACPAPLTGQSLSGPTMGMTGTYYAFTAVASPLDVTPPVTFTWEASGESFSGGSGTYTESIMLYRWPTLGAKTITVTAENCGGTFATVHIIDIVAAEQLADLAITSAWYDNFVEKVGYVIQNLGGTTVPPGHTTRLNAGSSVLAEDIVDEELLPNSARGRYAGAWQCDRPVGQSINIGADVEHIIVDGDVGNNWFNDFWSCDLTPPRIITGPTVISTTEHTAAIVWGTDEPTKRRLEYSWSSYGPLAVSDDTYQINHMVTLTGLRNGSVYKFQVFATDEDDNLANSPELFLETQPLGFDPPEITSVEFYTFPYSSPVFDFYTIRATLVDVDGIDRVEFTFNGTPVGTDYDAYSNQYYAHVSPYALGMTRANFFEQPHTIEVNAIALLGANDTVSQVVTPASEPVPADVSILQPGTGRTFYIESGTSLPAGTRLNVLVQAAEYEWRCTTNSNMYIPPGLTDVKCWDVDDSVDEINIVMDNSTIATHYPASASDLFHLFQLDLGGELAGAYTLSARAHTRDGQILEDSIPVEIIQGEPRLTFSRVVTRQNTTFAVHLTMQNQGSGTAYVDYIKDFAQGFRVIHKSTAKGRRAIGDALGDYDIVSGDSWGNSYFPLIEIDLYNASEDHITLLPGESFSIDYVLVPILYKNPGYDYFIGSTTDPNQGSIVRYWDATNPAAEEAFRVSGNSVKDPQSTVSLALYTSAYRAISKADYIIVTAPGNLSMHADAPCGSGGSVFDRLARLLSTMAELAYLKDGVLGYVPGAVSSNTLDGLIGSGGAWYKALSPNFRKTGQGYVLLVGEDEILPARGGGYDVNFSDLRYASTSGKARPELVLGRIVGDNLCTLQRPLQASVSYYKSGYGYDRSDAVLVSGRGDGAGTFWNNVKAMSNRLDDTANVTKIRWTDYNAETYFQALYDNTYQRDIIVYRGHGNTNVWSPGLDTRNIYTLSQKFVGTRPFVMALACTTGDYKGHDDYSIAEAFLQYGASVYIGSTETSSRSRNSDAARGFFNRWSADRSIGDTLYKLMRDKWGDSSWWWSDSVSWERWIYDYQLFGDPKFGRMSTYEAAGVLQPAVIHPVAQSVSASQTQITYTLPIPDFEVFPTGDGWDYVEIPGGDTLAKDGDYEVPYLAVTLNYTRGQRVQDVVLIGRSSLVVTTGLHIPTATFRLDDAIHIAPTAPLTDVVDPDAAWYPHIDDGYRWTLSENPDGSTDLRLMVYPFLYNPETTDVRFYKNFTFTIETLTSAVEIASLKAVTHTYAQGDPVQVEMVVNNTGSAQDVIVYAVIKELDGKPVGGLPLRNLHDLAGLATFTLEWDSTGFAPDDYYIEVSLLDGEGNELDNSSEEFTLGITSGEVTSLTATPTWFKVGDAINVSMIFSNTGTVPITGMAIIRVQDAEWFTITAEFTSTLAGLAPGTAVTLNDSWDTSGVESADYRIIGYVKYNGTVSKAREITVSTKARIYLPLVVRSAW